MSNLCDDLCTFSPGPSGFRVLCLAQSVTFAVGHVIKRFQAAKADTIHSSIKRIIKMSSAEERF